MSQELIDAFVDMREKDVLKIATELLDAGTDPLEVVSACRKAMEAIGQRFEKKEYFLPELILSGQMMKQLSEMVKPKLHGEVKVSKKKGRVIMGTVAGDIHDIGKDIVSFMLDVHGFEVIDLGVDVPAAKFVEAAMEFQPQVIGLSCLLTVAYESMKDTVQALHDADLHGNVKVMIGGGQIDEQIRKYTGADAFGQDAMAAVTLTRQWTGEE